MSPRSAGLRFGGLRFGEVRFAGLRPAAPSLGRAAGLRPSRREPREVVAALRRALFRHRRMVAAGCAGIAAASALGVVAPKYPRQAVVIAAAHDLAAGTTITAADFRAVALPASAVPAGAVTAVSAVVGRRIVGALRQGEPLTDVRIEGGPLARPGAGLVAAPVRFADPEAARLLQPGEHVDVLAASTSTSTSTSTSMPGSAPELAAVVAADVAVVAIPSIVPTPGASVDPSVEGALVVLATTPDQARALAQAQVTARLSAVVVG